MGKIHRPVKEKPFNINSVFQCSWNWVGDGTLRSRTISALLISCSCSHRYVYNEVYLLYCASLFFICTCVAVVAIYSFVATLVYLQSFMEKYLRVAKKLLSVFVLFICNINFNVANRLIQK